MCRTPRGNAGTAKIIAGALKDRGMMQGGGLVSRLEELPENDRHLRLQCGEGCTIPTSSRASSSSLTSRARAASKSACARPRRFMASSSPS